MRIILINSHFDDDTNYSIMPLTMYSIAALLRENNHEVKVYDPGLYIRGFFKENINDELLKESKKANIIAFSVNSYSWSFAKECILKLRQNGYAGKIITGGVHVAHCYEEIIRNNPIDFCIIGEAEMAFPKLTKAIDEGESCENIPGVVFVDENGLNYSEVVLTDLENNPPPLPAYDLVPKNAYDVFTFESSRGCYGNCTFCSIMHKKCWRGYEPKIVVERFKQACLIMESKSNYKNVIFTDDCFATKRDWAIEVLDGIYDSGFNDYSMLVEARVRNLFNGDLLNALSRFPNMAIQVGIESGYDEGLKKIYKNITVEEVFFCAKLLKEYNLNTNALFSFIVGMPWESEDGCYKTMRTAAELKYKYGMNVNCAIWNPLPSVELKNVMKNKNMVYDYFDRNGWTQNEEVFFATHPLLDEKSFNRIKNAFKIYNDLGIVIKS